MFPSCAGIVLAALLAGNQPGVGNVGNVVHQALPDDAVSDTIVQALPPPPETVVRETYFGNITIDHRAHLRRRAPCATCHGPGRVSKLEFTPKLAHDRCVGCHKQQALGPVKCGGCHVKTQAVVAAPTPGVQVIGAKREPAASAAPSPAPAAAAAPPEGAASATPAAAAVASPTAPPAPSPAALGSVSPQPDPRAERRRLRRVLHVGWSGGGGTGPGLRMSSRQGDIAITHSFDRIDGRNERRSIGLVGFGLTRPLDQRWRFEAVALGGFDLVDRPQLAWMPAVGARAGVEWQPRKWLFDGVQLSLTGVVDLSRKVSDRGIGGTVFATVSTGVGLPSR